MKGRESTFKVIVAEDEQMILNNIIKKINKAEMGFNVVGSAKNGEDALELIEKLSPDVLFTDIKMPVMDGLELLKNIASNYPYVKTVIISGYNEFEYAQKALKYGAKDYLIKPLKMEAVIEVLGKLRIILESELSHLKESIININKNYSYSPEEIAHTVELYIKENFCHNINFDLIAQNFNFNSSYLSKIFTKYIGENPSKYLITLRINKAKHLLLNNPELSIKEVGELVGYPDQCYFSRVFKSSTGKSPSTYRTNKSK